jgi:hypothetical protein
MDMAFDDRYGYSRTWPKKGSRQVLEFFRGSSDLSLKKTVTIPFEVPPLLF